MRPEDWPNRLAVYLAEASTRSFVWGEHDCALWAADWVISMGYQDGLADLRGQWTSAFGAWRVLKRMGGLGEAVSNRMDALGIVSVAPSFAQRGDIVLVADGRREALGICDRDRIACLGSTGLVFRPLASVSKAWRL